MRSRILSSLGRAAWAAAVLAPLALVPVGYGDGSANKEGGSVNQLPPEITKSNQSMEDFVKNQAAAKKK